MLIDVEYLSLDDLITLLHMALANTSYGFPKSSLDELVEEIIGRIGYPEFQMLLFALSRTM